MRDVTSSMVLQVPLRVHLLHVAKHRQQPHSLRARARHGHLLVRGDRQWSRTDPRPLSRTNQRERRLHGSGDRTIEEH